MINWLHLLAVLEASDIHSQHDKFTQNVDKQNTRMMKNS